METKFMVFKGRLTQFKQWQNNPHDWEKHWSSHSVENAFKIHGKGYLGEREIIAHYIPDEFPVLEAGCGLGQIVMALSARGYSVEGIDYSEETIHRVKKRYPTLNVHVGDIYHIEAPDSVYGAYISLGVLEHNPNGPIEGLIEARRVLHPFGFAFISIPYLNPKRKTLLKKVTLAQNTSISGIWNFYQYYFSKKEFTSLLYKAGFEIVEIFPLSVYWGLVYDYSLVQWIHKRRFFHWRIRHFFRRWCENLPIWARWHWAHMLLFICKPMKNNCL